MSFIGALLGAAPTVLGGIAKGKKDLEATTYQRQQEADQSAMEEQARRAALAQAMQQFTSQERDRALSRDLSTTQHAGTLKLALDRNAKTDQWHNAEVIRQTARDKADDANNKARIDLGYAGIDQRANAADGRKTGKTTAGDKAGYDLWPGVEAAIGRIQARRAAGFTPSSKSIMVGGAAVEPTHSLMGTLLKGGANLVDAMSGNEDANDYADHLLIAEGGQKAIPGGRGATVNTQRVGALQRDLKSAIADAQAVKAAHDRYAAIMDGTAVDEAGMPSLADRRDRNKIKIP